MNGDLIDLNVAFNDLRHLFGEYQNLDKELTELTQSGLSQGLKELQHRELQDRLDHAKQKCLDQLQKLIDFPPRHIRHAEMLKKFWEDGGYEESVFIMTNFPDGKNRDKDTQLEKLLRIISEVIRKRGYQPRIARGKFYHTGLWDNVELHLLGCKQGVALVEDKFRDELNPNVAMEWGWMRAMGKRVLFLLEKEFKNFRADLGDLISKNFFWNRPEKDIRHAIDEWLTEIPESEKMRN